MSGGYLIPLSFRLSLSVSISAVWSESVCVCVTEACYLTSFFLCLADILVLGAEGVLEGISPTGKHTTDTKKAGVEKHLFCYIICIGSPGKRAAWPKEKKQQYNNHFHPCPTFGERSLFAFQSCMSLSKSGCGHVCVYFSSFILVPFGFWVWFV